MRSSSEQRPCFKDGLNLSSHNVSSQSTDMPSRSGAVRPTPNLPYRLVVSLIRFPPAVQKHQLCGICSISQAEKLYRPSCSSIQSHRALSSTSNAAWGLAARTRLRHGAVIFVFSGQLRVRPCSRGSSSRLRQRATTRHCEADLKFYPGHQEGLASVLRQMPHSGSIAPRFHQQTDARFPSAPRFVL